MSAASGGTQGADMGSLNAASFIALTGNSHGLFQTPLRDTNARTEVNEASLGTCDNL